MAVQIQLRRDSSTNWTSANPTLAQGELGIQLEDSRVKIGDGATPWNGLAFNNFGGLTNIKVSAGALSALRSDITFANSNGVSFGLSANGVITASVSAAGNFNISAGTTSSNVTALTFANSNGVSFGFDGSNITATVKTDYLTTAMASNRGSDFVQATADFHGTNASGTIASNDISISVASQSVQSINISAGTTSSGVTAFTFANSNGVSWGFDGTNVTATVKTDYLTTAMASNRGSDFVQATAVFHGTNASGTIASGAISISVAAGGNNSINISAGTTSSNVTAVTFANSNGISFGFDGSNVTATVKTDYLTTAMASNRGSDFVQATAVFNGTNASGTIASGAISVSVANASNSSWTVSDSATSGTVGRLAFNNGGGVTFGLSTSNNGNHTITATVKTDYLTTAALSSQTLAISLGGNSATTNSSQILNGGYVLAGGNNITINQSNATVSIVGNAFAIANSQTTFANTTVNIVEGGGAITIQSTTGTSFKISVPQTSSIVGTSGVSVSTNGSTISIYESPTLSYFENIPILDAASTTLSAGGSVLQVVPFVLPKAISVGWLRIPVSMSYLSTEVSGTSNNSTWTVNRSYTDCAVIMSQNVGASSLSLVYVTSSSQSWVFQNQIGAGANGSRYTVTQNVTYPISGTTSNYTTSYAQSSANVQLSSASMTLFTGARWLDIPLGISLQAGNYWLALGRSTNSATQAGNSDLGKASAGFSYIGVSQNNLSIGFPGAATNSSICLQPGQGSWSTNAAVMSSSSLQLASISAMSSGAKLYFQMIRFA